MTQEYIPKVEDIYKRSGAKGFLRWLVEEGITLHDEIHNRPFYKVAYYLLMDDKQYALEWMEICVEMRSLRLSFSMKIDHIYDPLRDDPRFIQLLKKMNLD